MIEFSYQDIKKDFPILSTKMNGKKLVFLDSAASSQKPLVVTNTIQDYYNSHHANIHRGAYKLSHNATERYEKTRQKLAQFINAPNPESCLFTRNTTESLNLIALTWGQKNIKGGDEILVSELEHHSNLVPWIMLAKNKGAKLKYIPLTSDGYYDLRHFDQFISSRTSLIAVQQVSNALGSIHDLATIAKKARSVNALFVVDGAQGAPHLKLDVQKMDCDFYAFSAHKMFGPTGVGVLYGKKEIMEEMPPFLGGGDMILSVKKDDYEPASLPRKFEAGTPNISGVIAFKAAIDYITNIGLENIHTHEVNLIDYTMQELQKIEGIQFYGPNMDWPSNSNKKKNGGILSFNLIGVHSHDVASILDDEGIAVRAGHHCCEPWMRKNGLMSTVRASFYAYNGPEDVDALVSGLKTVRSIFKISNCKEAGW